MTTQKTNPLQSMTGYAQSEGRAEDLGMDWVWDVRSVNSNKGLDVRCRLPSGMDALEKALRERLASTFTRGSMHITLTVNSSTPQANWQINADWLTEIVKSAENWCSKHPDTIAKPSFDGLLQVKGVIETAEATQKTPEDTAQLTEYLLTDLDAAVASLLQARLDEGARMKEIVSGLIQNIADLVTQAESCVAVRAETLKARLQRQVAELMDAQKEVSADRLAQELAVIATRYDVREELDRLGAHIAAAGDLLTQGKAIGRKFDFLCQEFNREANTLCSKSSDTQLTAVGLELKTVIDRLREQIQNIE